MAIHTIMLPDMRQSDAPRAIIWDDEAGTVTGEHSKVPWMQGILARPTPVVLRDYAGAATLRAPGHDPADFLTLLWAAYWPVLREPLRSSLPPIFDGVEMTHAVAWKLPDDVVA